MDPRSAPPAPLQMADQLFAAQTERAMGHAPYGGADVAECLATAGRIQGSDLAGWRREWVATAEAAYVDAETALGRGDHEAARLAFWRASNYYRTAGLFTLDRAGLSQLRETHAAEVDAFRRGAALLDRPPTLLEIPYDGATLPGYFFSAGPGSRPTVIVTTGYDGSAEELYFSNAAAALERGYHALVFDGPGQGTMVVDRGVPFRPDWENVVGPVVDHALTLPGVDPEAVVLVGLSLGGYLAPRAAASDPRLAACVSDCGPYDLLETTAAHFPGPLAGAVRRGHGLGHRLACRLATTLMRKPTAGWALRRNLLVHDVDTVGEFFALARDYTLQGREHLIECPTFVCHGELDDLSALAPRLVDRLACEHVYAELRGPEAGTHCHSLARPAYHERVYAWLDPILAARRAAV